MLCEWQLCDWGLTASCTNRWVDKSLNYIVFSNGLLSVNGDVSDADVALPLSISHCNHLACDESTEYSTMIDYCIQQYSD